MPETEADRQVGRIALAVVVGAAIVRIAAAVIAGFITIGRHDELSTGRLHVADVLNAFGSAGESVGALIAAGAVALVWWLSRHSAASKSMVSLVRAVLTVTAVLVVARTVAVLIIELDNDRLVNETVVVVGFAAADLLLCLGGLLVLSRLGAIGLEQLASDEHPDEIEPLLFAVDQGNGEVFAFFSYAKARRTISIYSIEENEYIFYTDEGYLVNASSDGFVVRFAPTEQDHRDELMQALRRFAHAKNLTIEEPQDPTSYAVPVADWQWLELWPGWLRPIGRLVRRLQG